MRITTPRCRVGTVHYAQLFIALAALLSLLAAAESLDAQTRAVSGNVYTIENGTETALTGTNIRLLALPDSSMAAGAATDREGNFRMTDIAPGRYELQIRFLGFLPVSRTLDLTAESEEGLVIRMEPSPLRLDELQIVSRRPRVDVEGDTTRFHAAGYQSNPDASAEDLVRRMPGFMLQDGRLQAQGEDVERVLIDGEEFFGEDAAITLRNLPAEMIDQVELFDRRSEQSRFTGFDDGSGQRTLNIVTREGMNRGQFGRIGSGYGTDTRYSAAGNYNYFDGPQRITLLGMSNNVNQLNFSQQDLEGLSQGQGGGGRGGRGGGGGSAGDFRVGGQSGVSSVYSGGMNYNDRWGDSWRINSSYFFNLVDNVTDQQLSRQYLTGFSQDQLYDQATHRESDNYNHRVNMRLEHNLDERRSFIFTPRLNIQRSNSNRSREAMTFDDATNPLNEVTSINRTDDLGFDFTGNLLYRHRFETRGRTFSANLRSSVNDETGERFQFDESLYFGDDPNEIVTDRQVELFTGGQSYSADLSWTEPAGERGQIMLSYRPSWNRNRSIQDAFRFEDETGSYTLPDTSLSNRYENRVLSQRGRAGYRIGGERANIDLNLSLQHTTLDGEQLFPYRFETSESWMHLLPGATLRYRFEGGNSVQLSYNTSTRVPSARQLQDVIDDSDPLRLTTGNPDLNPQYDHRVTMRFRAANAESGRSTMLFLSAGLTENHIASTTFIARQDTLIQEGIVLGRGGRLISQENLGNSMNVRTFVNRSVPFDLISSNISLFSGVSYSRTPSQIDEARNWSRNYGLNGGLNISSNISPEIDFRISYRASYNLVQNTIRPELDNSYYTGRAFTNLNLMPWGGLVLSGNLNFQHYEGLGEGFNENSTFLNAAIGYKFLQGRAAEVRLSVFDILAQNDSVNRSFSDDYIQDMRSNVLSRYLLLTFSYNFRSFPGRPG